MRHPGATACRAARRPGPRSREKTSSVIGDVRSPIFLKGCPSSSPGVSRSTRNAERPAKPLLRIRRREHDEQIRHRGVRDEGLGPVEDEPARSRGAVVVSANASEPDPGSVMAWTPMSEPSQSAGRYLCFCSSVPNLTIGISHDHIWAPSEKSRPLSRHPYPSASIASTIVRGSASRPPNSSGTGSPWTPKSAQSFHASRGTRETRPSRGRRR